MSGPFIFIATNRLKPGKLADERKRVPGLVDFVEANEPRLVAFNEYVNDDGTEVAVVQLHRDAESMAFHMELIAERAVAAYAATVEATTSIQVFGTPSKAVLESYLERQDRGRRAADGQAVAPRRFHPVLHSPDVRPGHRCPGFVSPETSGVRRNRAPAAPKRAARARRAPSPRTAASTSSSCRSSRISDGHEQGADHRRVEDDPGREADPELLDVDARARREHEEREHQHERRARHELAGAREAERDRGSVSPVSS